MKEETRDKLVSLEQDIANEKGEFSLFGLFLREEAQDKWDLLVAAPWLATDKKEGLRYLADRVRAALDPEEVLSISRVVILDSGDPTLESIRKAVDVRHGKVELKDTSFSGVHFTHACISTSSDASPFVRGE